MMLLFMIGLGVTLVISSLLTAVLSLFGMYKLFTNEKFMKEYFKWFNKVVNITAETLEDLEEELES